MIVLDALDEVDWPRSATGNILHLPTNLPRGVFIIASTRLMSDRDSRSRLLVSPSREIELDKDAEWNRADVKRYIEAKAQDGDLTAWIESHQLTQARFVDLLLEKSEANFMYLYHVLPALGVKKTTGQWISNLITIDELPNGLIKYYRWHWSQMREAEPEFSTVIEPIICSLAASLRPVSSEIIADWTCIPLATVEGVLHDWMQFLCQTRSSDRQRLYSVYHSSFKDFLQDEVDPGLKKYYAMIARSGMRLFGITDE